MDAVQFLNTLNAPQPGAYTQVALVDLGNVIYAHLAGVTGNIPDGKDEPMIEGGLGPQVTQTLRNIFAILETVESWLNAREFNIVSMDVYLHPDTSQEDWVTFNKAYEAFFAERGRTRALVNLPPRASVGAKWLPLPGEPTLVEMKATAVISR